METNVKIKNWGNTKLTTILRLKTRETLKRDRSTMEYYLLARKSFMSVLQIHNKQYKTNEENFNSFMKIKSRQNILQNKK